jgi:hypothetical protein
MSKPTDPVSLIAGCGSVSVQKLNEYRVYTYADLIAFSGHIPDFKYLQKFKTIAAKSLSNLDVQSRQLTSSQITEISSHSWIDHTCHILRAKGQVTRVKIDRLLITPHRILMNVLWRERGTIRRKSVSPIVLVSTQCLWLTNDIVSDDSDSDTYDPVETVLPKFLVDTKLQILDKLQIQAICSLVKEVNLLITCLLTN